MPTKPFFADVRYITQLISWPCCQRHKFVLIEQNHSGKLEFFQSVLMGDESSVTARKDTQCGLYMLLHKVAVVKCAVIPLLCSQFDA